MTDFNLYEYEDALYEKGVTYIAGTDEAGRGPLAGPVVAAAVILKKVLKWKVSMIQKNYRIKKDVH